MLSRRVFGKLAAQSLLGAAYISKPWHTSALPTATPRFSVMLWTLTQHLSFQRALETVAAAGYNGVELVGEFHHWSRAEWQRHLKTLHSLQLTVDAASGVEAGFAVQADTDQFFTQLAAQIQAAQRLSCPQIILLSGARDLARSPLQQRKIAEDNLRQAADVAAAAGLDLVIEPIDPLENPSIFLQTVTEAFKIVREVNRPNLKVLYDFYHEQRSFGNLTQKLQDAIEWVGLVHVADVPGRHEPGTGEINYQKLYETLAKLKYRRWVAMEFYPTVDPVLSLQQARKMAQRELYSVNTKKRASP